MSWSTSCCTSDGCRATSDRYSRVVSAAPPRDGVIFGHATQPVSAAAAWARDTNAARRTCKATHHLPRTHTRARTQCGRRAVPSSATGSHAENRAKCTM